MKFYYLYVYPDKHKYLCDGDIDRELDRRRKCDSEYPIRDYETFRDFYTKKYCMVEMELENVL